MARSRQSLHSRLTEILGSEYVYFQPPSNIRMNYPAIVYRRDDRDVRHADNLPYKDAKRYLVTVIDRDPDSQIPDRISELPYCSFDRFFAVDGLNHDTYQLFF